MESNARSGRQWRFLVFSISGELYTQTQAWMTEADQAVMRYQFEKLGFVKVSRWHGERHFAQLDFLPAPGEAKPWYGDVGTGYTYTFQPQEAGCEVSVRHNARGGGFSPEPYPALHVHLPVPPAYVVTDNMRNIASWELEPELWYDDSGPKGQPWYEHDDQVEARQMIFRLGPKYLAVLAGWPSWGQPLPAYAFDFTPSGVGTFIEARYLANGDMIDVTKDVDW